MGPGDTILIAPQYLSFSGTGDVKKVSFPRGTIMFAEFGSGSLRQTFCYRWEGPHGFTQIPESDLSEEQKAEMVMYVLERKA